MRPKSTYTQPNSILIFPHNTQRGTETRNDWRYYYSIYSVLDVFNDLLVSISIHHSGFSEFAFSLQSPLEHPRQPHRTHSTTRPSSSFAFGTLQMHVVPKLVSFGCMHRRQQSFSNPDFFHFAIKFASA